MRAGISDALQLLDESGIEYEWAGGSFVEVPHPTEADWTSIPCDVEGVLRYIDGLELCA